MSLLTNGALVDDDTLKAVLDTETKVSVSIDGPQRLHDLVRHNVDGASTYEAALAGYRKLQNAGVNPGISCTLNKYNVDHIEEIAHFIAQELKPSGMGFNILLPLMCSDNPVYTSHEYASAQLINAFKSFGITASMKTGSCDASDHIPR